MSDQITEETRDSIRSEIKHRLADGDEKLVPVFYSISGSHLHGIADPSSDIDVQGFHCAEGTRYMLFDEPKPQIKFTTKHPELKTELEVVSHELRHFGTRLSKYQFNVIEPIFSAGVVLNKTPDRLSSVRSIISSTLPGDLPERYRGMAKSLSKQYLSPDAPDSGDRTLKHTLYALRGALAAKYVIQNHAVEPDLEALAKSLLNPENSSTVIRLIEAKQKQEPIAEHPDLRASGQELIQILLKEIPSTEVSFSEREQYQKELADWMLLTRQETDTC
jgi:predicted nucleotidyltransferase